MDEYTYREGTRYQKTPKHGDRFKKSPGELKRNMEKTMNI